MIFLDIETTSLDASTGIVIAIGFISSNGEAKVIFVNKPKEEAKCLKKFLRILKEDKEKEVVVWNSSFDIPFLIARCLKHKLDAKVLFEMKIIDLYKFVKENLRLKNYKLSEVCRFFGIRKLKIEGSDMLNLYLKALKGDKNSKKLIIKHCEDDVRALFKLYKRLKNYLPQNLT